MTPTQPQFVPHPKDLFPCPFCGQPAQITMGKDPTKVGCFNPACGVKPKASSTCESTATTHWNQRNAGILPALSPALKLPSHPSKDDAFWLDHHHVAAWIDAAKQLPDADTTVIIHCADADEPIWLGYHDGDEGWKTVENLPLEVSAWMNLPAPPEPPEASHG